MSDFFGALVEGAFDLTGQLLNANEQRKQAAKNRDLQNMYGEHGIAIKVKDAADAGIHPLYALGANTFSPTPINVGSSFDLRGVGQNINRAITATRDQEQRGDALGDFMQKKDAEADARLYGKEMAQLNLDRARVSLETDHIRNAIAASQLMQLNNAQVGPGLPSASGSTTFIEGQRTPPVGVIKVEPSKVTSAKAGNPAHEAGSTPSMKVYDTAAGPIALPSQQAAESIESIPLGGLGLMLIDSAGQVGRRLSGGPPPKTPLPASHEWAWNALRGSWYARPRDPGAPRQSTFRPPRY